MVYAYFNLMKNMVMTEQETNMDSEKLVSVLKCTTSNDEDRLNVYKTLAGKLRTEEDVSPDFIENCKVAINMALTDMCDKFPDLSQGSLQFLGLCIHNRFIVDTLSPKESENIIQGLCGCILHTEDKAICTRALWCLSNQIVHLEVLNSQLGNIIDSLDYSFSKPLSQSVLVEHEAVSVVIRLLQQIPKKMQERAPCWSHHVYGLLGHGAVKVREKALQALTLALPALLQNPNGLIPTMVSDVKAKMANELKKLFNSRNEVYVLRVWSLLVQLLGKELHCVFINQLLPIVELGFKSSIPNIKYEAFCAWKYLIENFAANPAIIGDQKRIKLLMQVFKINNAKTETVAMKKLEVWWYFVKKLDTKILSNFDMVCTPLLRFCVGGKWIQGSRNTPTPKPVNTPLTLPSQGTIWPSFASLQKKGLEVIAHLLKLPVGSVTLPVVKLELDALNPNVVLGPALFLKQSSVIAYATVELMCSVEASDDLVLYVWCLLVEHMRLGLEAGLKVDCRDALSSFLCDFSTLVLSRQAPYSVKYKLFLAVSKLPKKILCSTAYNISSGEKIHGTPALFLTELLLTPSMLEEGISRENYITLFGNLISMGMANPSGALEFCQALIQVLDRHAGFVGQTEKLLKLWLCIAYPLLDHIKKSNEVNQGDALEHNFTSLYQTLFFPVKWLFGNCLSQISTKCLLKTWGYIYRTFANLAALVVNASANITCEHVSHLILERLSELEGRLKDSVFLECLVQLCEIVLSCVNFSSHSEDSAFALSSSPGKWNGKRKQKPLKNLNSFVSLLAMITSTCNKQLTLTENNVVGTPEKQFSFTTLQLAAKGLVGIFTTLFAGITTSSYIPPILEKCAGPVSGLFAVSKKVNNKIYPASFLPKIDKLWQDIIYCSQNVYTGMYDSDFLSIMTPLLEVSFMHTRRSIKLPTVQFWNATFGQSQSLIYPESLRPVLSKVKMKSMIMLPGWISTEIQIIGETPTNQFSETSSQVADEIPVPTMLSPSKMHGSMLKNVLPSSPSSLIKPKPVKENSACKKLSISELKDKDFVVIDPPQNKCRILTQHQQEVLRERKFSVPAMYNSLDQSQDSIAFSNSMSNTQIPSQESSDTFTDAVENKSGMKNAVKPKKKVNFLDQSNNKLNIITNSFSNQDIVMKDFALTAQENIAMKPKIQKETVTKMLQNPVTIQSIKTKDNTKSLSPGKVKNTQDVTPLQNWLSTKSCEVSKNSIQMEPHMSSLIEDSVSTFDLPACKVSQSLNLATEAIPQKNLSFVEETQSPIKVSPKKVSAESILETPVKTPVKEINRNLINTRQLSFDSVEKMANVSSESPTQDEQSPCETAIELSPVVNSKPDDLQMVVAESEPFDNTLQKGLPTSNSGTCDEVIREDSKNPLPENVPVNANDTDPNSVSKDNFQTNRQSQKRKISTSPDPAVAKRTKLNNFTADNNIEVVHLLSSSDDCLEVSLDSSINISGNSETETDNSKLHSTDSHEENSPPRKRLTGSRKRKPLKVTKLTLTSPSRRISPVKTRSWGKVLRTRKKAVQNTDGKDRKMKRHYKKCKMANNSDSTLIALTITNKDNTSSVVANHVLGNSLEKSIKGENPAELSIMKDLNLKPLKSEEMIAFVNGSIIEEKDKSISSDHNALQVESLDSSQDVSVKSDSASDFAIEEKTVGDSSQDSISSPDENVNSQSLRKKENSTLNSLVTETPKKSLRLRSGSRGFPSKFSDSFIYGIKISTSPTSNTKKSQAQKSVMMKTSPPQKSVQLTPKDTSIHIKAESNNLTQPLDNAKVAVDKSNKVESSNLTRPFDNENIAVDKSNKVESSNLTQPFDNENIAVDKSNKVESSNLTRPFDNENIAVDKSNKVESSNLTRPFDNENIAVDKSNKVESSNLTRPFDNENIAVDKSNKVESSNLTRPFDNENIAVDKSNKVESSNLTRPFDNENIAVDKSNKVESSNLTRPFDNENIAVDKSNKVESSNLTRPFDNENIAVDKSNKVESINLTRPFDNENIAVDKSNKVESSNLTRPFDNENIAVDKSKKVESSNLTRPFDNENIAVDKSKKVESSNLTRPFDNENIAVDKSKKVESSNLTQPFDNENITVDKSNEPKNKEPVTKKNTIICSDLTGSNNFQFVEKDNIVVNSRTDISFVQSVPNTDSVASNKLESNSVVESITDNEDIIDKIESNVDESVIKDNKVNKVEPTMVSPITDKNNINSDKIELLDVVQPIAANDSAMSDTEVVAQPFVNKDNSVSNNSIMDNPAVLVATPSTKPPPTCDTPENILPCSYSPSPVYSPTTGILKKRLVNGSGETPSPPNKQRRVSFADPIFEEKTLPSPVSQKRRLTPGSSKSSRRSLLINYKQKRDSANSNSLCHNNSPNGSQSSYSSSQESQLNCTDPIFPNLVNCQEPVGQILPQLTSSIWSRGLGQLLRAKKIHTIGDLASMSEYDIHNLPVRSPKVSNVKTVLTNFKQQQDAKKKSGNTSISEIMAAAAAAHTSSMAAVLTTSSTTACEPDMHHLEEKESKIDRNVNGSIAASENSEMKTLEKMETSPTVPEIDASSSFKSDIDDSTLDSEVAASKKECDKSPNFESTNPESTNSDDLNSSDLSTSISVLENPEASSTPVKAITETKESNINVPVKEELSCSAIGNSTSGDQPCCIKPICLEKKFSSIDCNVKDATDEQKDLMVMNDDDDDKGDYSTVEDDVKSILENSGALLEEVEKLSQSVQELERSPRSPKCIRKKYKEPESPELEGTEGFDVDHLLPNMAEGNSKNVLCCVNSAVQKDLELLPTLKDLSTKFTAKEIRELDGEEIHEAHECLQQLFSSVMKAVIPGPKKQINSKEKEKF